MTKYGNRERLLNFTGLFDEPMQSA